MERRKVLSVMGSILVAMLMVDIVVASESQGTAPSQREGRRHARRQGTDGRQGRRRHDGQGKRDKSHVHKWKGHREQRGKLEKAREGGWKNRWHGGRGFDKHASHMWHRYGWFWDDKTKSWYQCTPVDDPKRGYGCEYKGKWYSMVKSKTSTQMQPQTMPKIEEIEEDEDIVEVGEQPMPIIEDVD